MRGPTLCLTRSPPLRTLYVCPNALRVGLAKVRGSFTVAPGTVPLPLVSTAARHDATASSAPPALSLLQVGDTMGR